MNIYQPKKIFLEEAAVDYDMTQRVLNYYSGVPVEVIKNSRKIIEEVQRHPDPITYGKQFMLLARQKGRFLKKCPGTKNYICCGYKILNTANNCDLDCSYCILQGYFNNPLMVVYVNIDDLLSELAIEFEQNPARTYRIGTGELTDSLILEPVTNYGETLVRFFKNYSNAIIELKTKSINIDNLLKLDHQRRTVVSWSLNAPQMQQSEEPLTPTLDERIAAAVKCQQAGYRLGFHFDPMFHFEGWEQGYREILENLFSQINGENIAWISLGALRYPPYLDSVIRQRRPDSKIVYGEFITGKDSKYRYFKPIRIEMFRQMNEWIKEFDPSVFVYLCMESDEVWRKAFGWSPKKMSALAKLLDARIID